MTSKACEGKYALEYVLEAASHTIESKLLVIQSKSNF